MRPARKWRVEPHRENRSSNRMGCSCRQFLTGIFSFTRNFTVKCSDIDRSSLRRFTLMRIGDVEANQLLMAALLLLHGKWLVRTASNVLVDNRARRCQRATRV